MKGIPVEILHALLRLDPETGKLYWRERGPEWFRDGKQTAAHACARWNARYAGREALNTPNGPLGYRVGTIFGSHYLAHTIVFALIYGRWPSMIDHRDHNPSNNRPDNLREATSRQNNINVRGNRNTSSQFRGVTFDKKALKWRARMTDQHGSRINLGLFQDEISAAVACDTFAAENHGEFACLNFPTTQGASA